MKKPPPQTLEEAKKCYSLLSQAATNAESSWALAFEIFAHERAGEAHGRIQIIHEPFFRTVAVACETTTIVNLHNLYNAHEHTYYLESLLDLCANVTRIDAKILQKCRDTLLTHAEHAKGILRLRHNVFAHSGRKEEREKSFKEAKLKFQDLDDMIGDAHRILADVSFYLGEKPSESDDRRSSALSTLHESLDLLLAKFNGLGGAKL